MQEVVPGLQAADLLRQRQGAQGQAPGLVQAQRLPHLHHLLHPRPPGAPSQEPALNAHTLLARTSWCFNMATWQLATLLCASFQSSVANLCFRCATLQKDLFELQACLVMPGVVASSLVWRMPSGWSMHRISETISAGIDGPPRQHLQTRIGVCSFDGDFP